MLSLSLRQQFVVRSPKSSIGQSVGRSTSCDSVQLTATYSVGPNARVKYFLFYFFYFSGAKNLGKVTIALT